MKYYAPSKLSENIHVTREGFLLCPGVPIARTGEQEYIDGETPLEVGKNGKVIVTRTPEEVFSPKTIASFEGKAVTIKHPAQFVDPKNWKELAKGHIQNVRRGDGENKDDLLADILITDSTAISLVKSGLRGLSCGYECEYDQTGEGKGVQKNIIGNHLALVEEGRAGPGYEIIDSKGDPKMAKKNSKFADKLKALIGQAVDEAAEEGEGADEGGKEGAISTIDKDAWDKMCGDLKAIKDALEGMKPKDEEKPPVKKNKEEGEGEDDEESTMESRMTALEAAVEKILAKMSGGEDEEDDDDDGDGEDEESDVITDEDADEGKDEDMTGDAKAYAEILAPGIKAKPKDLKVAALKQFAATADGKAILKIISGSKRLTFDNAASVDMMFNAAAELMKAKRKKQLVGDTRKQFNANDFDSNAVAEEITTDKINEANAKFYATQQA